MNKMWLNYFLILPLLFCATSVFFVDASLGDKSGAFENCRRICIQSNCSKSDPAVFVDRSRGHDFAHEFLFLSCWDECDYECMWRTVDAFIRRGRGIPQFFGKWPFIMVFGIQEPASALFSLLNLVAHIFLIRRFRRFVQPSNPMYQIWHYFFFVCCLAWISSTIFHTRDRIFTEFLDYTFAYAMVLCSTHCMLLRMIYRWPSTIQVAINAIIFAGFLKHAEHLASDRIDYGYNMIVNVVTGVTGGLGWVFWCLLHYKSKPYAKKGLWFVFFGVISMALELFDFPPILYVLDAHAIWHATSIPIIVQFYEFIIADCRDLDRIARKQN